MKLSESLRKNIMTAVSGRIMNTFKARQRRYVLFFEDILAQYIKECEEHGHGKDIMESCQKAMNLVSLSLPHSFLKKVPVTILFNNFLKRAWINIGIVDDLHVTKHGNRLHVRIKNGQITRIIGRNNYTVGLLMGIFNIMCNCNMNLLNQREEGKWWVYDFGMEGNFKKMVETKGERLYDEMNYFKEAKGIGFKDVLKRGTFLLKKSNRIYFRGKEMTLFENTLFHILSQRKILMHRISSISYDFFRNVVMDSSKESKLILLKNLLQIMGWGLVTTSLENNTISITIKHPPYGLQKEEDNWNFLVHVILGYLWLLDRSFKIKQVSSISRMLKMEFSTS